jgi:hypothetical protein
VPDNPHYASAQAGQSLPSDGPERSTDDTQWTGAAYEWDAPASTPFDTIRVALTQVQAEARTTQRELARVRAALLEAEQGVARLTAALARNEQRKAEAEAKAQASSWLEG